MNVTWKDLEEMVRRMGALGKITTVSGIFVTLAFILGGSVDGIEKDAHVDAAVKTLEVLEVKHPGSQMWGWGDTDVPLSVPYPVISKKLNLSAPPRMDDAVFEYIPQKNGHYILRISEPAGFIREALSLGDEVLYERRTDESYYDYN